MCTQLTSVYLHSVLCVIILMWLGSVQPVEAASTVVSNTNNAVATAPGTPTTPGGSKLSPGNIFKNFFKWVLTARKMLLKYYDFCILSNIYVLITLICWQQHGSLLLQCDYSFYLHINRPTYIWIPLYIFEQSPFSPLHI